MKNVEWIYKNSQVLTIKWKKIPLKKWCAPTGNYNIMYRQVFEKSSRRKEQEWKTIVVNKEKSIVKLSDLAENKRYNNFTLID